MRSLGGAAVSTFACPRRARSSLAGHADANGRHGAIAVLLAVAALARHVPATDGAALAGRAVPTTLSRLGELALVRGARLDVALHALSRAGLIAWSETAAGVTIELADTACADHPVLATVPWEVIAGRLAADGVPRTSAFALFVELALLTEASISPAAALGPLAASPHWAGDPGVPRLAPDFGALAQELGYHRSRLTPAVKALDALGLVTWDAESGMRGTVRVTPWALGLGEVSHASASAPRPSAFAQRAAEPSPAPAVTPRPAPPAAGPAAGAPQCVLLGATPVYVAPGTPLDFSARTPDGRPALRFSVNGVEVLLPLGSPAEPPPAT